MQIVLFDTPYRENLLPLTFTLPTAELRVGIWTIREKWQHCLNCTCVCRTEPYLQKKYPYLPQNDDWTIAGNLLPDDALVERILRLNEGEALYWNNEMLACKGGCSDYTSVVLTEEPRRITRLYHLFLYNSEEIARDFARLTQGRTSAPLPEGVQIIGDRQRLFIEEGANVLASTLNVSQGVIYIGKNAEVMEGSLIRGPFALCEHATVKMGSRIYGGTTVGPHSKVGGEIAETVFWGYSNKAHDGYLGNSVIGRWCNIGAGVNASNLKNDYAEVKLWDYPAQRFLKTGLQFCGLILGDHSKIGIGCILNTGTVIGVGCNIHGSGFPRNYIPSFLNGGSSGYVRQNLKQFLRTAEVVVRRRNLSLDENEKEILTFLYDQAAEG